MRAQSLRRLRRVQWRRPRHVLFEIRCQLAMYDQLELLPEWLSERQLSELTGRVDDPRGLIQQDHLFIIIVQVYQH